MRHKVEELIEEEGAGGRLAEEESASLDTKLQSKQQEEAVNQTNATKL